MANLPTKEFEYYLTYNGVKTELLSAPEDWDTQTIGSFKRDENYSGLIRTLSLPLSFVLDGYNIVKQAFINDGYEAEVLFDCYHLNRSTFAYVPLFSSNLDFSEYNDDGIRASVALLESGISSLIKAQENTKYEYPISESDSDTVLIQVPGVPFSENAQYIFVNDGSAKRFIPKTDLIIKDLNSGFVTAQSVNIEALELAGLATSPNWFVKGNRTTAIPLRVQGTITWISNGGFYGGYDFYILLVDQTGASIQNIFYSPNTADGTTTFDFTVNLNLNQKFFIYLQSYTPSGGSLQVTEGDLKISYEQVSDDSFNIGIRAYDLFKRIIAKIAPTQSVDSYILDNNYNNLIITCGNALRELENPVIQTTLSDFFDTFNGIDTVGMGIENDVLLLEIRPYFFQPTEITTLTGVKECSFSVATDLIFNSVQVGYNDGNTDDIDGQYEYNSKQEWALPVTRIQRKENWISPYRADQYGIEKLRVDFVKKTNDTSSDNDVFMFDCYLDTSGFLAKYRPILGSDYTSVSGLASTLAESIAYNLSLTPKDNLLKHGSYLISMLDKLEAKTIEFASAEKNKDLQTVKDGVTLNQSESFPAFFLTGKYFKPIVATLQCKLPKLFMRLMDANPFGYIKWDWQGKTYKGYVIEVNVDLAKNTEREIKLLLSDDNEM